MLANSGVCKFYTGENTTHGQTLEMLYLCVGGGGGGIIQVPLRSLTSIWELHRSRHTDWDEGFNNSSVNYYFGKCWIYARINFVLRTIVIYRGPHGSLGVNGRTKELIERSKLYIQCILEHLADNSLDSLGGGRSYNSIVEYKGSTAPK